MKWFGEPWPSADCRAPVCEDEADRVPPPPPGEECVLCDCFIEAGAQGVVMPHLHADMTAEVRYAHIQCLVKNVGWH